MAIHPKYISLYSGGGGLDIGFQLANPDARPILYVEREFQAAALLVDHIEAGMLEPAPVWADTRTLDCGPFVDQVDWIIGGFPCQPFSVAGTRSGTKDDRWLWPHIERLVREIRPRGIFVENVPGLIHGGIEHVLGGMASLGFDAEWISVRASDVGAPHRRERVFIMAHSRHDARGTELVGKREDSAGISIRNSGNGDATGAELANSREWRRNSRRGESGNSGRPGSRRPDTGGAVKGLADSEQHSTRVPTSGGSDGAHGGTVAGSGSELAVTSSQSIDGGQRGEREPTGSQRDMEDTTGTGSQVGRDRSRLQEPRIAATFPPGPGEQQAWSEILEHRPDLAPAVESPFRRMADGTTRSLDGLPRVARLRILGNGVVPQAAALAFQELATRMNLEQFYKRA